MDEGSLKRLALWFVAAIPCQMVVGTLVPSLFLSVSAIEVLQAMVPQDAALALGLAVVQSIIAIPTWVFLACRYRRLEEGWLWLVVTWILFVLVIDFLAGLAMNTISFFLDPVANRSWWPSFMEIILALSFAGAALLPRVVFRQLHPGAWFRVENPAR